MEKISFVTSDNIKIVGNYYPANGKQAVILLHMMPAIKESWQVLAQKLNQNNTSALAIDLRGHGESQGGPEGYRNFSDVEHQASMNDLEASLEFLKSKSFKEEDMNLAGASIGANLALWFLVKQSLIKKAVLLSAGYDYRGLLTKPLVRQLHKGQAVYIVGSQDDNRNSGESCGQMAQGLYDLVPGGIGKALKIFESSEHGTDIFTAHLEFVEEIADWLTG